MVVGCAGHLLDQRSAPEKVGFGELTSCDEGFDRQTDRDFECSIVEEGRSQAAKGPPNN